MPNLQVAESLDELLDADTLEAYRGVLGIQNLDNTSDAGKPVSIAQQTALDAKQAAGTYVTPTTLNNGTLPVSATTLSASGTVTAGNLALAGGAFLSFATRSTLYSPADGAIRLANYAESLSVTLALDGTNTLAQRNATAAQRLVVANTWTDSSNYEYGVFDWQTTANTLRIGTSKLGTGATRALHFIVGGTPALSFDTSAAVTFSGASVSIGTASSLTGTVRLPNNSSIKFRNAANTSEMEGMFIWTDNQVYIGGDSAGVVIRPGTGNITLSRPVIITGHQTFSADNTYDIGASGATRPRNIYVASDITAGGGITGEFIEVVQHVTATEIQILGTKVLGAPSTAIADATDAGTAISQLNLLLAAARTHGWLAT